ncbi:hypothetical protein [Longimicrobium terrae]|uniref:Uncharacterized protein n=1 Tax=Longimicrobium terrae TaxID=1639882 RepID=A0A841GQ29_9BACT|nr:hypothetical protein [Longimicrobium terrae]MBB4634725.1 hypothetical protein [Longimicrobium terrae]MBB6069120.1 hypothetical protein [Longimicrobium terrae]NNC32063.1 hypothetical protein [Longimicrobium terrae]
MKKKLRLEIDELRVEQFGVQPDAPVARGTVRGFASAGPDTCVCGVGPSAPWKYCLPMPETWSCNPGDC